MRLSILAFALGVWLCQQQAQLPDVALLLALAGTAALPALGAGLAARRGARPVLAAGAALIAGFVWASVAAHWRLADALPEENEGRDVRLVGVIADLPQAFENGVRFQFAVEGADAAVPSRLLLAWYQGRGEAEEGAQAPQPVHAGERWQLTVRLKRPHGNRNPHGFDYEAYLFERGIRATGYVRAAGGRLDAFVWRPGYAIERLREEIRSRFLTVLPEHDYAGVLVALVVGDQRAIETGLWQVFSRTGTTHLMSISGLHVTMVAGLFGLAVSWCWRRFPSWALRLPAQKAAVVAGAAGALLYALLAGFGVPAQRTLYMLAVVGAALWLGRIAASSRVLALALLAVLIADPWAVLSAGFWLSFGAVAVLFFVGSGRLAPGSRLAQWGRAQWAVTIGLVPALLALFQQLSLVSPLANAVAIPVVSLVITPLALLGAVLPADALLLLDHALLSWLMRLLERLADLPAAVWQQAAPPPWTLLLGAAGCVWLLLPRGFPARWLGAPLLLPLLTAAPERPAPGEVKMTVLDVGQGLAVHVQTRSHDLLYDTGPLYSPDANGGNRVILPYLRAMGVGRVHGLIVTHQDKDHSGGVLSVLDGLAVDWIASSLPEQAGLREAEGHRPCFAGQSWEWDGVRFDMLHPRWADYQALRKSNDLSCVLRVSAGGRRVLLTGDIETPSERALLARGREDIAADVVLVPHHGSKTSSGEDFVAAVAPATAIVTAGYRNRFRHPHPDVTARYLDAGARLLRTDRDGAVTLRIGAQGSMVELQREVDRRYWHGV